MSMEPGGQKVGTNNFSHRTAFSFVREQWRGAKDKLQEIPVVGALSTQASSSLSMDPYINNIPSAINLLGGQYSSRGIKSTKYDSYNPRSNVAFTFPSNQEDYEIKTFGENTDTQFITIKTPNYYTNIYVGTPAPSDFFAGGAVRSNYTDKNNSCLLYTSPSPRYATLSRMPSSA